MARNFDDERRHWDEDARTFVIRGETFVAREHVHPSALALYESRLGTGATIEKLLEVTDQVILEVIEGGDWVEDDGSPVEDSPRQRYLKLRERRDDPIGLDELHTITEWIFEAHAIRPTQPSSDSLNGGGRTGASSTGGASPAVSTVVETV